MIERLYICKKCGAKHNHVIKDSYGNPIRPFSLCMECLFPSLKIEPSEKDDN